MLGVCCSKESRKAYDLLPFPKKLCARTYKEPFKLLSLFLKILFLFRACSHASIFWRRQGTCFGQPTHEEGMYGGPLQAVGSPCQVYDEAQARRAPRAKGILIYPLRYATMAECMMRRSHVELRRQKAFSLGGHNSHGLSSLSEQPKQAA